MIGIEVEDYLEIVGGDFQAFVRFAFGSDGAGPIHGDGAGQEFLRHEDGERLRAAAVPIIYTGKDGVLIVQIVVEHDDHRGSEREILLERVRGAEMNGHLGDAIGERDVRAAIFVRLCGPIVGNRSALWLEGEVAGDGGGGSAFDGEVGGGFGGPSGATGSDFEFFVADDLVVEKDLEFSLVVDEDRRLFLISGSQKRGSECEQEKNGSESNQRPV